MERIQYGVIGCGEHALKTHALPNKDVAELELAAVYDLSERRADYFADESSTELQKFTDRQEFLQKSTIGAVLIGTPDECHLDDLRASVKAGKHTFVEKPLAVNLAELEALREILDEADEKSLIVSSCHPRRFDPPFMWLKDMLPALREQLGDPLQLKLDFSYHKPVRSWKHDRGLLLDHANHEIDLVNYLFGHNSFEAMRLVDGYDRYQAAGVRDDGISFDFSGTRRLDSTRYPEWASIRFETGEVMIDTHKGFARTNDHETGWETVQPTPVTNYELRGSATMKNFGEAILGLTECYLSQEDLYVNTAFSVMLTNQKAWRYDHGNTSAR
jgi:predicted dehydrogenase